MKVTEVSPPGLDRRESHRVRYFAEVAIEWGASVLRARIADISLGGMLVEMANPLWLGAEFLARLALDNGPPVEVTCVVRRIVPSVGMRVEFTDLKPADHTRLRQLIESLPH